LCIPSSLPEPGTSIPSLSPPGTQRCVIDSVDDASRRRGIPRRGAKRSPPPIHRKVTRGRGDAAPIASGEGALRARGFYEPPPRISGGFPPARAHLFMVSAFYPVTEGEGTRFCLRSTYPCPPLGGKEVLRSTCGARQNITTITTSGGLFEVASQLIYTKSVP
jgi:hypothetical protein